MQTVLLKIAETVLLKLITETFLCRLLIRTLRGVAERTTNKLDDGMVNDLADALGCEDLKVKL